MIQRKRILPGGSLKARFSGRIFPTFTVVLLLSACFTSLSSGNETAQGFYQEARAKLEAGDSSEAGKLLNSVLELEPDHGLALLDRGYIYLAQGSLDKARVDFQKATGNEDKSIRALGHRGLGDVLSRMGNRHKQASAEYMLATKTDPACREAYYSLAETGFILNDSKGYRMAAWALSRLVCLDPEYLDSYSLWRERIQDQTEDELRKVSLCLEAFLAAHPEKSYWWLDVARDRFRLGRIEDGLAALEKFKGDSTGRGIAESALLKARCLLELNDSLGFENNYFLALQEAGKTGDFKRIFVEAEPIFNPQESLKWSALRTAAEKAAFFRIFWRRRDPDPFTFHNERLVAHYRRLHEAEKKYPLNFPHSLTQNSRNQFRRVAPSSPDYEFDPDIFFNRSRGLGLDQRGLLFLRHGEPDVVKTVDSFDEVNPLDISTPNISTDQFDMNAPGALLNPQNQRVPTEIWYYGKHFFPFEKSFGAGDYMFVPVYVRGAGNIEKAMENESFNDPLPPFNQDYYMAYFQGPKGLLEMEFYQSAPLKAVTKKTGPEADLAVFDNDWAPRGMDKSVAKKVATPSENLWVAVNSITVDTTTTFYALRMDIPGHRAVSRKKIDLKPFHANDFDLSGIILGTPPSPEAQVHSRMGVDIIPRPSLTFRPGEIITVYLEIYNLRRDWEGKRTYRESVTVTLDQEEANKITSNIKRFIAWSRKGSSSLTLSFDRQPTEEKINTIPEHFDIDTSELVSGKYRLVIEIQDNVTGQKKKVGFIFALTSKEKS